MRSRPTACGALLVAAMTLLTAVRPADDHEEERSAEPSVHYTEIVCADVEAQCKALASVHGLEFGEKDADYGTARVAKARDGSLVGVRAPLASHESPIIRTYRQVDDIAKAVEEVEAAGGMIAYGPVEQGDTGQWAIYFLGDLQFGLWQR